ncbi:MULTISPECIES: phage tail protein [Pseudomonas]|uniref:phage tail protein n=1 Tax=Pseudomonas TaxID=286 RepID=UPI00084B3993|nr:MULTISPECIES: phage tail protein [Pseudomonas]MBW9244196.1 phage tail protein [Pseudomonas paracarnis]OEC58412.1 phage tail protein [Pseudomonas sp. AP42]QHA95190.1 phage tail protein [Pseudomonas sp. J380]UEH09741.1 phage tail protein [Pseudomonas sp. HN8-3]
MALERFTWCPRTDPQGQAKFRVRTKGFGDGYAQSVSDGINNKSQSWPLTFLGDGVRTKQIMDFIDAHKGARGFLWTPPLGELGLYKCDGYQLTPHGAENYTLTATFEQNFQP